MSDNNEKEKKLVDSAQEIASLREEIKGILETFTKQKCRYGSFLPDQF